ncbi:hypothetical protein DSO57_1037471 [Entomophthora muscae]|uniref:Uncharacterized protein n=1 Tax=Entomophthora muscae TaxID=34485 RepID=A0ACC2SZI3_9FUNG|nr:hypothetical protein DSO57_1037471 [Entomophthora muscae]
MRLRVMTRLPSIRELFPESFLARASISSATPAPPKPYHRHRMSPYQTMMLENVFCFTHYPDNLMRRRLASVLDLPLRTVQIWFQNKRQKLRPCQAI